MKVRSAPSITRVHRLHRIRTVSNYVTRLAGKGVSTIDDLAVADYLIETQLSKATVLKLRDQIGRRARDHLESARYLGLLYRQKKGGKFTHAPTDWGKALSSYKFYQECPSAPLEEAIFVDRVCRLKLTNPSYMQETSGPYVGFRSRLCFNLLSSLKAGGELDVYQLGYILAEPEADFAHTRKIRKLVRDVQSKKFRTKYIKGLTTKDRRNVKRDTQPFIDWCKQVGLVRENEHQRIVLTERGKRVVNYYSKGLPLWWPDLGPYAELAAAGILLITYLKHKRQKRNLGRLLKLEGRWRLFGSRIGEVLNGITKYPVKRAINNPNTWFDFSFSYDVPPESWGDVKQILQDLIDGLGMRTDSASVIKSVEWKSVKDLTKSFEDEAIEVSEEASDKYKVKATVPTASVQYSWQSDYEAATYLMLQQMQKSHFSVAKYQGQLTEFFVEKSTWKHMSEKNPDILITDGFMSLVECKSVKEWASPLKLGKPVMGELTNYSNYAQAVGEKTGLASKVLAIFSYEGEIEKEHRKSIDDDMGKYCPRSVLLLRQFLQKALTDGEARNTLRSFLAKAGGGKKLPTHVIG